MITTREASRGLCSASPVTTLPPREWPITSTWVRSGRSPFLDVFDCPDPSTTAPRRAVTTTPLQALALLNNSFVLRMADRLAARLAREAGDDLGERIHSLFMLAYGRRAAADEVARLRPFVDVHGLPALCRVIFNSSEFLYVD
ncbi:MAG: DUF1553 domain-containing protein [Proteobacteria bacterium]|nr:DUF1553 domain-containing protein [Pseudomonadota bacterium]